MLTYHVTLLYPEIPQHNITLNLRHQIHRSTEWKAFKEKLSSSFSLLIEELIHSSNLSTRWLIERTNQHETHGHRDFVVLSSKLLFSLRVVLYFLPSPKEQRRKLREWILLVFLLFLGGTRGEGNEGGTR